MKKLTVLPVIAALLLTTSAMQPAHAQGVEPTIDLGVRGTYEVDDLQSFALGAGLRISGLGLPIIINPTFDYYFVGDDIFVGDEGLGTNNNFPDVESFYQFTANALIDFGFENRVFTPYAGAGVSVLSISYAEDEDFTFPADFDDTVTDIGLNLLAGASFSLGRFEPFVQANFVVGDEDGYEPAAVSFGLLFSLTGP